MEHGLISLGQINDLLNRIESFIYFDIRESVILFLNSQFAPF